MGNYVLDRPIPVLTTYNTSNAAGVTAFRVVKFSGTVGSGSIDLDVAATTAFIGVVQDAIDRTKVATGRAIADVRVMGITRLFVAASGTAPVVGDPVVCGSDGGVVKGVTATNIRVGTVVSASTAGTIANGDIIEVLLTPGAVI